MDNVRMMAEWMLRGRGSSNGYNYHCKKCKLGFNHLAEIVNHITGCFPEAYDTIKKLHPRTFRGKKVEAIPAAGKVSSPVESMSPALSPASTLEFFNFISAELTAARMIQKDQENLIQRQIESIEHLQEKLESFKKIKVSNETATLYQEYTRR